MTEKEIIDNIARLNSETWKDREEVRTEIGKQLSELKKALEQPTSDDCVSRASVKELFQEGCVMGVYDFLGIDDLPPVTPTRKVGKWIRKPIRNDKGGCIGAEMICSCCNKDNRHDEYMDFCPNCGAKMRGCENG